MSPRSILKQSSQSIHRPDAPGALLAAALPYPPEPPQVHFPPTPSLTKTYPTHSGSMYDRAPIVVLPNDCALPERGCPGRTYTTSSRSRSSNTNAVAGSSKDRCSPSASGKHVHPRVVEDIRNRQFGPPPLIPDISSSESDESDGVVSPPPEYSSVSAGASTQHYYAYPVSIASPTQEQLNKALAFLPHAPSLPSAGKDCSKSNKERKRRSTNGTATPRFKSEDNTRSFAETSLDGCLGGF